ncbi:DNA polymerase III alpha subunit (gram-positive type) [Staphylococcus auricularis]|nr:putative lipoprotein [Staphylococcus auricularis]
MFSTSYFSALLNYKFVLSVYFKKINFEGGKMKKVLWLILTSTLVLSACSQYGKVSETKNEKQTSSKESKKEHTKNKDDKDNSKNASTKNKQTESNETQPSQVENNNTQYSELAETQSQMDQSQPTQNNGSQQNTENQANAQPVQENENIPQIENASEQPNHMQAPAQNPNTVTDDTQTQQGYMTQAQIDEWNRTKPTTHDESQLGYGTGDYEGALKESKPYWNDPNGFPEGNHWVKEGEDYDSWATRQAARYGLTHKPRQ